MFNDKYFNMAIQMAKDQNAHRNDSELAAAYFAGRKNEARFGTLTPGYSVTIEHDPNEIKRGVSAQVTKVDVSRITGVLDPFVTGEEKKAISDFARKMINGQQAEFDAKAIKSGNYTKDTRKVTVTRHANPFRPDEQPTFVEHKVVTLSTPTRKQPKRKAKKAKIPDSAPVVSRSPTKIPLPDSAPVVSSSPLKAAKLQLPDSAPVVSSSPLKRAMDLTGIGFSPQKPAVNKGDKKL